MVCKITSTNARLRRSTAGVTLVENVIGMAIALIVMAALCAFALLSARSFDVIVLRVLSASSATPR